MGSPELIIPVRMDVGKAILQLQHIDGTDRKVGDEVTKETAKGKQGLMRFEDGSANTSKSLLELPHVQLGTSSIRVAAGTVGEEFKRAGAYVKHIANEFTELRKHMHDVMTLKGSADCNEVAVEGAQKGTGIQLPAARIPDCPARSSELRGKPDRGRERECHCGPGPELRQGSC